MAYYIRVYAGMVKIHQRIYFKIVTTLYFEGTLDSKTFGTVFGVIQKFSVCPQTSLSLRCLKCHDTSLKMLIFVLL